MADPDKDPVNMKGKSTDLTPWPQEWHRFHRLKMLVRVQPVSFWVYYQNVYPQTIKVNDRSTMLNLMVGLNGYTLCSGIISSDFNGDGYIVVPFREDEENPNSLMELGYITKKNNILSRMGGGIHRRTEKVFQKSGRRIGTG